MDKKKTNEQVDVNQANLSAYHGILSDSLGGHKYISDSDGKRANCIRFSCCY